MKTVRFYTYDLLGTDMQKYDRIEHGQDELIVTNETLVGMLELINQELLKRSMCGLEVNKEATIKLLEAEMLMKESLDKEDVLWITTSLD